MRTLHLVARPIALLVTLTACDPGVFDELVGSTKLPDRDAATDASLDTGALDATTREDATQGLDANTQTDTDAGPVPDSGCPQASDPANVRVSALELGPFTIPPVERPTIVGSARMGARMLWLANAPGQVAIWTGLDTLSQLPPVLPGPASATSLLPANATPSGWTTIMGGVVVLNDREALIYFVSNYIFLQGEVGIAHIALDQPQADLIHPAGELFAPRRGAKWIPLFYNGVLLHDEPDGSYIYVYACNANPDSPRELKGGADEAPCRLARARLTQAQDGTSYRYWSGDGWVSDVSRAAIVIDHVPTGLSLSYNHYLQKFVAVHSDIAGNQIAIRWADRPEGPWHPLKQIETLPGFALGFGDTTSGAREHLGLRNACNTELYIMYDLPQTTEVDGKSVVTFETRLVRATLY